MSKLKLTDIKKTYRSGEIVHALRGVSLEFRENEFVSILGPSGCGKTTLLNVIGGLDRYDSGNVELSGLSTKSFKDADWDAYRNRSIGFVFQTYNLIGHQSVLQNVEIALTLSGVSAVKRKRRAKEALMSVGLSDQIKKKPNQLSGGQMQRVAIARALINNPEIILADEPTGALDSHASVQLMEILKEIAKTRLVILVTHNSELAENYSNRIVRMLDGKIQSDSNPLSKDSDTQKTPDDKKVFGKTSMSMYTAASLSFRNLLTKKGRTIITSLAGSIGIMGLALVLALSLGLTNHLDKMQEESLSAFPISITEIPQVLRRGADSGGSMQLLVQADNTGIFPDDTIIRRRDSTANAFSHINSFTQEFFDFVEDLQVTMPEAISAVFFVSGLEMNVLAKGENVVVKFDTLFKPTVDSIRPADLLHDDKLYWQEMFIDEEVSTQIFDLLAGRIPREKNEVLIVVDDYNHLYSEFFDKLGMFSENNYYDAAHFIDKPMLKVIFNDDFYTKTAEGLFVSPSVSEYEYLFENANGIELTITGIGRKNATSTSIIDITGLVYTKALAEYIANNSYNSEIARAQMVSETDVITNTPFTNQNDRISRLRQFGSDRTPLTIEFYSPDFNGKEQIKKAFDNFNVGRPSADQIVYNDIAEMIKNLFNATIGIITLSLSGFAAISLIVSTLMIGIITYISVLERTKEIGILRAVGARKKDISRVFNAEVSLIGFTSGIIGVVTASLLVVPMNKIIINKVGLPGVANLSIPVTLLLIIGSIVLTLIAGLIPSRMAAKKDPVVALRTE